MENYLDIAMDAYRGFGNYLIEDISHPTYKSPFWRLMAISVMVWGLEVFFPWRTGQGMFRKDFWLDGFYLFFNSIIFPLLIYAAVANVAEQFFIRNSAAFGITLRPLINLQQWPNWLQLLVLFLVTDFIQWNIHRLLHRVSWLWQFHKVHHSVKEMGFAAHFRFHPMEIVFIVHYNIYL
jgi:Sterol desaturase